MAMKIMVTAMSMAMTMAVAVAITVTMTVSVGRYTSIAPDVGIVLAVTAVAVTKTTSMKIVVDCQEQAGSRVTKIPIENNRSSYFNYILKQFF